jgi:hypothetical protein
LNHQCLYLGNVVWRGLHLGRSWDGATRGEAAGTLEVTDSHISYLASQLELERGRVRELTQHNLELSRQVHTREYLQNAKGRMQYQEHGQHYGFGGAIPDVYFRCDEYGSHEATPEEEYYRGIAREGYNARSQGDYGPYGNVGYQDCGHQEYNHLNKGALEGSLYVNNLFHGGGVYHPYGGEYVGYTEPYAFTPYHAMQAPTHGGGMIYEQGNYETYTLPEMGNEENRHDAWGRDKQPAAEANHEDWRTMYSQLKDECRAIARQMKGKSAAIEDALQNTNLPFTPRVLNFPLPPKFKVLPVSFYDRTANHMAHLDQF